MKIYVIVKGEYSDWEILSATTDEEKAIAFIEKYNKNYGYNEAYIVETSDSIADRKDSIDFQPINRFIFNEKCEFCDAYTMAVSGVDYLLSLDTIKEKGFCVYHNFNQWMVDLSCPKIFRKMDDNERDKYCKIAKDYLMKHIAEKETL